MMCASHINRVLFLSICDRVRPHYGKAPFTRMNPLRFTHFLCAVRASVFLSYRIRWHFNLNGRPARYEIARYSFELELCSKSYLGFLVFYVLRFRKILKSRVLKNLKRAYLKNRIHWSFVFYAKFTTQTKNSEES